MKKNMIQDIHVNLDKREDLRNLLLDYGKVRGYQMEFYTRDQRIIHVDINVQLFWDDSGQPEAYEGTFRDITQPIKTNQALQESNRLLDNIIDNLPLGLASYDKEGNFQRHNKAHNNIFKPPEGLLNSRFNILSSTPESVSGKPPGRLSRCSASLRYMSLMVYPFIKSLCDFIQRGCAAYQ